MPPLTKNQQEIVADFKSYHNQYIKWKDEETLYGLIINHLQFDGYEIEDNGGLITHFYIEIDKYKSYNEQAVLFRLEKKIIATSLIVKKIKNGKKLTDADCQVLDNVEVLAEYQLSSHWVDVLARAANTADYKVDVFTLEANEELIPGEIKRHYFTKTEKT